MQDVEGKLQIGVFRISEGITSETIGNALTLKSYEKQGTEIESCENFSLSVYHSITTSKADWKNFFHGIVKSNQDLFLKKGWNQNYVLVLQNENHIYAVTGGLGYFAIKDYIDEDFGIDLFSRLIKKEDKIIKSIKERSFIGGVLGEVKYFRTDYNLYENDSFGKIYREFRASLNKEIMINKLGFSEEDIKKGSACIAKSSFKITKPITFDRLIEIINGFESIIDTEKAISINNVIKLEKQKNQELIIRLENELLEQLWLKYNNNDQSYQFDLCHRHFEEYLTAEKYEIRKNQSKNNYFEKSFETLNDISILFDAIKQKKTIDSSIKDVKEVFFNQIKSLKIFSFDQENKELTSGELLKHILGDVEVDGKRYFLIDNVWYQMRDEFINDLNETCGNFITNNWYSGIDKPWNYKNGEVENSYVKRYIGEDNTIVMDQILYENIEVCDILKWDDKNIYFIHAKAGFGNLMRDLCAQVFIAAKRIKQDLSSKKVFIEKLYDSLESKIGGEDYFDKAGNQTKKYSKENFLSLFDKPPIFVLAIHEIKSDRDLKNIIQFRSNIAKFSLQDLIQQMRGLGIGLKITQIMRQ